jgi:hypothetical protein
MPFEPKLVERYAKLIMRGYYKLLTIGVVVFFMSCITAFALRQLWVAPDPPPQDGAGADVPDTNERVDALRAQFDVEGKYRVYNSKLDEMVARGGMSPRVAKDARRDASIFDRTKDEWSDTRDFASAPDGGSVPSAFNPKVTLSGT